MIVAIAVWLIGILLGLAGLWASDIPDWARFLGMAAFLLSGIFASEVRHRPCGKKLLENEELAARLASWGRGKPRFELPNRICFGCGQDRLWAWPTFQKARK